MASLWRYCYYVSYFGSYKFWIWYKAYGICGEEGYNSYFRCSAGKQLVILTDFLYKSVVEDIIITILIDQEKTIAVHVWL